MANSGRSIFRERAIEKYIRRQEQHVILRLASPPTFVCLWVLFLFSLGAATLVGFIQVPIIVSGEGMVIEQTGNSGQTEKKIDMLLLLPPDQQVDLRAGDPVTMHIESALSGSNNAIVFKGSIEHVEVGTRSPANIRTQFNLPAALAAMVPGPSVVATARVEPESLADTYLGSQGRAEIQIGSERALFLMPGIGNLLKQVGGMSR